VSDNIAPSTLDRSALGSVLGVLVLGLIQTLINFQGTLSSWWTKIVIGLLLLAFILLQRLAFVRKR
jgi:simple sugar transport system permease protein